jgi:hypothetical protein
LIFSGVKVFSATRAEERGKLGDYFTAWSREHPELQVVETRVLQSSDSAYHCFTIVVFYDRHRQQGATP